MEEHNSEPVFNAMPPHEPISESPSTPALNASSPTKGNSKWIFVSAIVVLVTLGGLSYYLLGSNKNQSNASKLSPAWLTQYFNVDVCTDLTTCGETADPDKDGLSNYDEFRVGISPVDPDFDGDGLADGDEVNIYKTNPKLKFTDKREIVATNNWTDGFQIKGGYDPLTPGQLIIDTRKQEIELATTQFKLHEPSITTLGSTSENIKQDTPDWKAYTNAKYKYSFEYSNDLAVLECSPESIVFNGNCAPAGNSAENGGILVRNGDLLDSYYSVIYKNFTKKPIKVSGVVANQVEEKIVNELTKSSRTIHHTFFVYQNNTFEITFNQSGTDNFTKDFDRILSTFKFINSNQKTTTPAPTPSPSPSTTTSLKTYRNDKYGFELQYPSDWVVNTYTYPSDSFSFSSPEFQGKNVIGEISVTFTKINTCPTLNAKITQVGNVAINKYFSGDKLTAGCIVDGDQRINFGLSTGHSYIPYALPVLDQMLSSFKFTK